MALTIPFTRCCKLCASAALQAPEGFVAKGLLFTFLWVQSTVTYVFEASSNDKSAMKEGEGTSDYLKPGKFLPVVIWDVGAR